MKTCFVSYNTAAIPPEEKPEEYVDFVVDRPFTAFISLGSNLEIKSTKVSLSDTEPVDIPEQDFGFDIVNGKTSVDISTENDHYSMKVRKNANQ